jgi:tetratricopeptide (TPR) repeat protein
VDKSLVTVQLEAEEVRYRLLETVRQYAAERLEEAGEGPAAQRRHRDHFLLHAALPARALWSHDASTLLRRAAIEEENFTAALSWSLEQGEHEPAVRLANRMWLHWFWAGRRGAARWLERALAGPDGTATPDRVKASLGLAMMLTDSDQSDRERSERLLNEALELAGRLGDRDEQFGARLYLSHFVNLRGNTDLAARFLVDALEACEPDDLTARGWCHYGLGNVSVAAGDPDQARWHLERALDIGVSTGFAQLTCHAGAALAPVAALGGDTQRAEALADNAVVAATRLELPAVCALALTRGTEARIIAGDVPGAQATLRRLLGLLGELGGPSYVADALEMAALLADAAGRPASTARLLATCETLRAHQGEPLGGMRVLSQAVRDCAQRVLDARLAGVHAAESARGRAMCAEEAVAQALAELDASGG